MFSTPLSSSLNAKDVVLLSSSFHDPTCRLPLNTLFGVQIDGNDESVQSQDLSENEDEDHSDEEPRLLRRSADTSVSDDADSIAGRETRQADGKSGAKVDKAPEKKHVNYWEGLPEWVPGTQISEKIDMSLPL